MKETKKKGRAKKRRWSPGTRRVLRSGRATCRTFVSICARGTVLTLACPPLVVCNSVSWRQCAAISLFFFFSVRTAYLGGLGVKKRKKKMSRRCQERFDALLLQMDGGRESLQAIISMPGQSLFAAEWPRRSFLCPMPLNRGCACF